MLHIKKDEHDFSGHTRPDTLPEHHPHPLTNGALPAHPVDERNDDGSIFCTHLGLTKRELFAAMVMQGMAAGAFWGDSIDDDDSLQEAARVAVAEADALLAALGGSK